MINRLLIVLIIFNYGCNRTAKNTINKSKTVNANVLKIDTINIDDKVNKKINVVEPIIFNNLKCFEKKYDRGFQNDGKETSYKNEIFSLKIDNKAFDSNLVFVSDSNKSTYILKDDTYEMADFDMKIYRLKKSFILIFETIDYYSSTVYIYMYVDDVLTRLGGMSIDQPNVEKTGIKKESFKICKENDTILLETYLNNKLYSTHKLKIEKKNIVKKAKK